MSARVIKRLHRLYEFSRVCVTCLCPNELFSMFGLASLITRLIVFVIKQCVVDLSNRQMRCHSAIPSAKGDHDDLHQAQGYRLHTSIVQLGLGLELALKSVKIGISFHTLYAKQITRSRGWASRSRPHSTIVCRVRAMADQGCWARVRVRSGFAQLWCVNFNAPKT